MIRDEGEWNTETQSRGEVVVVWRDSKTFYYPITTTGDQKGQVYKDQILVKILKQ